jgi:NAD(P)-dependent dehydrogenase (short-subunit alcohol dehydrogenase family)
VTNAKYWHQANYSVDINGWEQLMESAVENSTKQLTRNPHGKLAGKVALITGGSSGMGLATARTFWTEGAQIVITGRDKLVLAQLQEEFGEEDALVTQSDTADVDAITILMQQIKTKFGRLDILFANAGIADPAPFMAVTPEQFDKITNINFRGVFFTIQKAIPLFDRRKEGSIIITTAIANQMASKNFSVYAAGKRALCSLVQTLVLELNGNPDEAIIRINALSPGPIETPMFNDFGFPQEAVVALKDMITNKSPSRRFGTVDEIAKVALFLACDESSYITGQELPVDGGMNVH